MSKQAPEHLSAEAKRHWGRFSEDYDFDDGQCLLLESALESFDRVREAQAMLAKEGAVYKDRWGQPRAHPAAAIERDSKGTMLRFLKQLGLDLEPLRDGPGRPAGVQHGQ